MTATPILAATLLLTLLPVAAAEGEPQWPCVEHGAEEGGRPTAHANASIDRYGRVAVELSTQVATLRAGHSCPLPLVWTQ